MRIGEDIRRKMEVEGRCGFKGGIATALTPGTLAVAVYRFGRWAGRTPKPVRPLLKIAYAVAFYLVQALTGISVQAYARIGRRFVIRNHSCIFVLAESIGNDFTICQGVTVGNIRGSVKLPTIGSNVYLEAGCKVLGGVTIGDNVVVRANGLVLADVPANSMAVGNPARIVPLLGAASGDPSAPPPMRPNTDVPFHGAAAKPIAAIGEPTADPLRSAGDGREL